MVAIFSETKIEGTLSANVRIFDIKQDPRKSRVYDLTAHLQMDSLSPDPHLCFPQT